eukprot:m.88327 g.88327  ORF g.88327 m.88327 type:complete len:316 (+) comp14824_c0_seq6:114-1061(+)
MKQPLLRLLLFSLLVCFSCSIEPLQPRFLLIVASGPQRAQRRTWMRKYLVPHLAAINGKHWFFLDGHNAKALAAAEQENATHGDVLTVSVAPGLRLGERLRDELRTVVEREEEFDYLLMGDDDTFWCWPSLSVTLAELADPWAYAGWPHCEHHHFLDQHALILGRSLVEDIVQRYHSLKCSPYGGISLRHWQVAGDQSRTKTTSYGNVVLFHHHRTPVNLASAICQQHVSVHYVKTEEYWQALSNNAVANAEATVQSLGLRNARPCSSAPSNQSEKAKSFELFLKGKKYIHTNPLARCDKGSPASILEIPYDGGL